MSVLTLSDQVAIEAVRSQSEQARQSVEQARRAEAEALKAYEKARSERQAAELRLWRIKSQADKAMRSGA